MVSSQYILGIAVIGAIAFLAFQGKAFFKLRPFIKAVMGIALGAYCSTTGDIAIAYMGVGFILSALGDYFLDFPDEKFFIRGLISFFLAHLAFLIYLWPHATWALPICIVICLFTLGFFLWLKPSLDKELVVPVAAYSLVIGLMGCAAMTTSLSSALIPIGAALFIASDMVLSVEKFKTKFPMDKTINWILYASGQIALAVGVVSSL